MASSKLEKRIATLRTQIFSYKPGKAIPCDKDRLVFPDKLVIGVCESYEFRGYAVHALRHALHGHTNPEASKLDAIRQTSTETQEEYVTNSISVITQYYNHMGDPFIMRRSAQDLAGKAGCMVLLTSSFEMKYYSIWTDMIKIITDRASRALVCCLEKEDESEDTVKQAKGILKEKGVTDIYELPYYRLNATLSDEEQLEWLEFLHVCLCKADSNPLFSKISNISSGVPYLSMHHSSQAAGVSTRPGNFFRIGSDVNADFDGILKKIAKALYKTSDIDDLGCALGFGAADIGRYVAANAQQGMNHMGTVDMLRTWRKGQTWSTEKAALRSALLNSNLRNLADRYLSTHNPDA